MPINEYWLHLIDQAKSRRLNRLLTEEGERVILRNDIFLKFSHLYQSVKGRGKGLPQQAEVAQGFPGSLRPQIFLTFGTTRVVGRQPYGPAAFTPGEIPGSHFRV